MAAAAPIPIDPSPDPAPPAAPTPVTAGERIEAIDVIRGFALFGVFLANMHAWFRTSVLRYRIEHHPWPGLGNRLVDLFVDIVISGKFMSLFSFLFGAGLAVQMERAEKRIARPYRFLSRRLGILALIAAAHVLLVWMGDILHLYAVLGFLLMPFLRRKSKTILIWVAGIFTLPLVVGIIISIVKTLRHAPPPSMDFMSDEKLATMRDDLATAVRIYGHGTWLEIARYRLKDFVDILPEDGPWGLHDLAMFMLGVFCWKTGIFQRPRDHRRKLAVIAAIGFALGIGFGAFRLLFAAAARRGAGGWGFAWVGGFMFVTTALFSLAYAASILLAIDRPILGRILAPLAPLGRMALTNYLMQSILATFIFYGYGLGLYDRISPMQEVPIVVGIYAAQIVFSKAWLKRYRFGPAEWAWRSLTYGKMQPMKIG